LNEPRNIAIICNPKSGKGKPLQLLPLFENFITQHQFNYQSFTGNLPNNLNNFTDLVIMGGDGTINYTLNHFKHINIPVGMISCGTGNDIATLLLGNTSTEQQFETALFGAIQKVDAGMCNHKLFINGVGIGFDGWVVKRLLAKNLLRGKAAYYSTVISLLLFYNETKVSINIDGEQNETNLFMLSAANGKTYGGGFKVAPLAEVNDGLLEIIVVDKLPILKRLRYLPVIENGKHLNKPLPFLTYKTGKKITVQSTQKLKAHLDGEYMEANHFEIEVLPQFLSVRTTQF
jgi:YegS/Rv2252/BmrU family lipid kinase